MNSRALIKYSFSGFLMLLILALTVPSTVEYGIAAVLGIVESCEWDVDDHDGSFSE